MENNAIKSKQFMINMVWRRYECNTFVFPIFRFIDIVMLQFSFRYLLVFKPVTLLSVLDRCLDFSQMSAFYLVFDFVDFQVQIFLFVSHEFLLTPDVFVLTS